MAKKAKTEVKTTSTEEQKILEQLMKDAESKYGSGAIVKMGAPALQINRQSTGSLTLDGILWGGIPEGKIVEIYGPESSGKTTVSLLIAAEIQRKGWRVAFIDAEQAFNQEFAELLGVDKDKLFLSQPDNGEQAFELLEDYAKTWLFDLIIVDSVSALTPKSEIEGDMGDAQMGAQARMMGQGLRKVNSYLNKTKTSCIFINQLRQKIGVMFGNPETTSGGNSLKFYASIRLDTRKGDKIMEGKEQVGHKIKVTTKKNKTFAPFKQTFVPLYYNKGFDKYEDMVDAGKDKDIIKQAGAYYSFVLKDGEQKFQGKDKMVDFFKENPAAFEELKKQVTSTDKLSDSVSVAKDEIEN